MYIYVHVPVSKTDGEALSKATNGVKGRNLLAGGVAILLREDVMRLDATINVRFRLRCLKEHNVVVIFFLLLIIFNDNCRRLVLAAGSDSDGSDFLRGFLGYYRRVLSDVQRSTGGVVVDDILAEMVLLAVIAAVVFLVTNRNDRYWLILKTSGVLLLVDEDGLGPAARPGPGRQKDGGNAVGTFLGYYRRVLSDVQRST